MQDAPMCNAGAGSNLTLGGHAECDASVMAGDGAFGALGAVSGRLLYTRHCHCTASHWRLAQILLVCLPGLPLSFSPKMLISCSNTNRPDVIDHAADSLAVTLR